MSDLLSSDNEKASAKRLASGVGVGNNITIDDDLLLRNANLLDLQINSLYAASRAVHKAATILNKLGIPLWL